METLKGSVDLWKVGKVNHMKDLEEAVDWRSFLASAMRELNHERVCWKEDLIKTTLEAK